MLEKRHDYEAPAIARIGAFESLTRGGTTGTKFDGTFVRGQPVPFNPSGQPLIFS